jgi:hypothetical protein
MCVTKGQKARERAGSWQAEAPIWSQVCHLPIGCCTAPTQLSASSELGIGASADLITGHGALVAHLGAHRAPPSCNGSCLTERVEEPRKCSVFTFLFATVLSM